MSMILVIAELKVAGRRTMTTAGEGGKPHMEQKTT